MKKLVWLAGTLIILSLAALNIMLDIPLMFRFINPLLVASLFCLARILFGPTAPDRSIAIDTLGILIIGICGIIAVFTKCDFFIDIAIAWALQSFIAALALAKYLEGRSFDE